MNNKKSSSVKNVNFKKVSFFYQFFLYISLVIISIIITSSIVGNRLHTTQLNNTIKQSNEKILSLTSYNFSFMYQTVESFVFRLSNDVKVNQLLYMGQTSDTVIDIHRLMEVMTSYKNNAEFIQSYYIYNGNTRNFFTIGSSNTIRKSEEMFDQEIVEIIAKIKPTEPNVIVVPRTITESPYSKDKNIDVYTYVFSVFDREGVHVEKVFVVNVLADWFIDSIHVMKDQNLANDSQLVVVQNDGTILAHSDRRHFDVKFDNEDFFMEVMSQEEARGSLTMTIEGTEYIVSYNKLVAEGINVISLTEKDQLYSSIKLLNFVSMSIMIVLLILGIVMSYMLSKFFYKPISNLKSNLSLLFDEGEEADSQGNEFQLMQSLFEDVHSNMVRLKSFKKTNMESLKEQMLVNILQKKIIHLDEVEERCKNLEFKVNVKQRMQLLFFDIDYYKVFEKSPNINARTEDLKTMILQLMSKHNGAEVVNYKHYFAVLVNVNVGQTFSQGDLESIERLRNIQEEIKAKTDVTLTITVSPSLRTISDLYEMYIKLKQLHQVRLTKGRGSILFNDVEEITDDFQLPVESTKKMLSYLMGQETEKCQEKCHEITTELHHHEINNVRLAISFMSISIIDTINTIKSNARLSLNLDFNEWHDYVFSLETLTDIDDFFCETMANVVDQMKESKKNRSSELVSQIKDYIGKHYQAYSMTPNSIAKAQGLTLKYANTLFKKDTGSSIASYINDFRLDQAAELLIKTDSSVDNILDLIGWENQSYFFTVFKKRFSVTPSMYRINQ